MSRIISRVIALIAIVAALVGGIYYALVTTVADIRIEGADECAIDKFSLDDYSLVVTSKAGTEKSYPLATLEEELEGAKVTMPDELSLEEDEDEKTFKIIVEYEGITHRFPLTLTRGTFDDVGIIFNGETVSDGAVVNATYSGKGYGVDFADLPEGTKVTAYQVLTDAVGNVTTEPIEDYKSAFVDAGIYQIMLNFECESFVDATKTITIKIDKKTIKPKLNLNVFEFDGNPAEIEENFVFMDGSKQFEYDPKNYNFTIYRVEDDGSETLVDAAIEIGNYKLYVSDKGETNYTFAAYEQSINIFKEYRVTFRQKGVEDVVVTVKHGDTVKAPNPQTIKGYKFNGWNWGDKKASDPVTCDFIVEADVEVISYTITFVITDAEKYINQTAWADVVKPATYTVENASEITLPVPPMNDPEGEISYYFDGWYLNGKAVTVIPEGSAANITLTAKAYEIYTYNYTVDGVEKTVSGRQPTIYNLEHEDKTNVGYKFTGWTVKNAAGEVKSDKAQFPYAVSEAGLQFVSNYELIDYKIYFRGNKQSYMPTHPTVNVPTVTYTVKDTIDLAEYVATYAHCDFNGWYYENGTEAVTSIPEGSIGDIHLYAHWTAHDVKLVYSSVGENVTGLPAESVIKYYSAIDLSKIPTRYGYNFLGWSLSSAEGSAVIEDSSIKATADVVVTDGEGNNTATIYAMWSEQEFEYHYSTREDGKDYYLEDEVTIGTIITLVDFADLGFRVNYISPDGKVEYQSKEGKFFLGWKNIKGTDEKVYLPGDTYTVESQTVFVPVWENRIYNITFNANTTDKTLDGNLPVWAEGVETRFESKLPIPASTLTREHYEIVGWSTSPNPQAGDATYPENPSSDRYYYTIPNKDTVLYAVWAKKEYSVTFNYNNLAGTTLTLKFEYGEVITISDKVAAPKYTGYTLDGWYELNGSEAYTDYTVEGDVTLECRWTPIVNKLVYKTGYGENAEITSGNHASDSKITLPECAHKRSFYLFKGWKDTATRTVYKAGDEYKMPAMDAGSERVLEAQWELITYTVEFNIPGFTDPKTYEFNYEMFVENEETGKLEYPLTYAMMGLTGDDSAYIFRGWYNNGVEITSVTIDALSELYNANPSATAENTIYYVDVDVERVEGYSFEETVGGYSIISYNGANDVKLPTHYNGLPVVEIGTFVFDDTITSVTFAEKNNITAIGILAFFNCEKLTEIVIPKEVVSIGKSAFQGCALTLQIYLEATEKPAGFVTNWNATGDTTKPTYDVTYGVN